MRSGTSFFNWPVFKKTVLRFWPVWAAYSVVWLVAMPIQGLVLLRLEAQARPGLTDGYIENFARGIGGMEDLSLIMAVVFGLLCAMAVCSHLYNARSANFFGGLPVRREGLFLTHYLAGLAFLIVPNVVIFLLTLLIEAVGGFVFLPGLGFWLAAACGECFFFYSMAVFCGMFTGHILALPVFYGVFNVFALGVRGLCYTVLQSFYYGYDSMGYWSEEAARWLTPVWKLDWAVNSIWTWPEGALEGQQVWECQGLDAVAVYAVAAVAFALASFFLYRARRLESAGDVVSVKCMRPVFKYGVAVCVGLGFGMSTAYILRVRELGMMVSILIWGAAGYFAAQMLLDKSFRVFKKWKGAAAVSGVFIALFCVVGLDLTGFETRLPDPDQVVSVSFSVPNAVYLGDGADHPYVAEYTDPEVIRLVTCVHQGAVDQRALWSGGGVNGVADVNIQSPVHCSLQVSYQMKDGSTLSRRYSNMWLDPEEADREGTAAWAVEKLYQNRDLYWMAYGFDEMEEKLAQPGWRLSQVEDGQYAFNEEDGYQTVDESYFYGGDARTLLDAVETDFRAGRIGLRSLTDGEKYPRDDRRILSFRAEDGDGYVRYVEITVGDEAESTLAALERLADRAAAGGSSQTAAADEPTDRPVPTALPIAIEE